MRAILVCKPLLIGHNLIRLWKVVNKNTIIYYEKGLE